MKQIDLRNSGPFTPEEAAKRVKLASQQFKWFTLCHPYWALAQCSLEWKTTYPLPPLVIPKGVQMTSLGRVDVEFDLSDGAGKKLAAAFNAGVKLAGLAGCSIHFFGRGGENKPGLWSLRLSLTTRGNWEAEAEVYIPRAINKRSALKLATEAGYLSALKGWKVKECSRPYRKNGCMKSCLTATLSRKQMRTWLSPIKHILASQASPIRQGNWSVPFTYNFVEEKNWWVGSHLILKRPDGRKAASKSQQPERLLQLVGKAGFPSGTAEVDFDATVDRVEDFLGLFKLASICSANTVKAIGIFETERGKQGFLMFDSSRKGIRLVTCYGENGWEDLHEELRRTNGKPVFSAGHHALSTGRKLTSR